MAANVKHLQVALNRFNRRFHLGFAPLIEDGRPGHHTNAQVRHAKYLLGYEKVDARHGEDLIARLDHPRLRHPARGVDVPGAALKRGRRRRSKRRRAVLKNRAAALLKPGVGHYDGRPVARQFIPYMQWARTHVVNGRVWTGHLVSGFRTPAYSEHLCYSMCGAPSCAGRCAGRSSRHSQTTLEGGAADVSDYDHFKAAMAECPLRPQLHNTLGSRDPVHFSVQGN